MDTAPTTDNTLGAMFIGVVLSAVLFGVSCLQTWEYFNTFEDAWYMRAAGMCPYVGVVFLSDSIHQAFISHTVYYYLISNYAQPAALNNLVWSLVAEVLFNGLTAFLVQGFFTYRIWRLSHKNIYITTFTGILVLGNFAVLLIYNIKAWGLKDLTELPKIEGLSEAINACNAGTDITIAACMCFLLYTSRSGFKKSDTMIRRLIIFVVNTGLLTSICALASLVSILVWPNTYIYICFFFIIGRLYSNSLMAALNSRSSHIKTKPSNVSVSFESGTRGMPLTPFSPSGRPVSYVGAQHGAIQVTIERKESRDFEPCDVEYHEEHEDANSQDTRYTEEKHQIEAV